MGSAAIPAAETDNADEGTVFLPSRPFHNIAGILPMPLKPPLSPTVRAFELLKP